MHMPSNPSATAILERLAPQRWPLPLDLLPAGAVLVGGAVRDALLARLKPQPDLDLVVPSGALALTRTLANRLGGSCVVLDQERDMARLVLRGWTVDIARQDGSSLEADLQRRDYRLNAIALPLHGPAQLIDPTGGLADLQQGRLTAVRESNLTDDPLRLLRGLRLMAEIPLSLDPMTAAWMRRHRRQLTQAAPERILAELQKLVAGPLADQAIEQLCQLELIQPWAAGQPLPTSVDAIQLTASEQKQALPLARLTALISDQGLEQLKASRALRQRCRRLRQWQQRLPDDPETLPEAERVQLHLDLDRDLAALVLQLNPVLQSCWLRRWRDPEDPLFHPASPVDGTTLQRELKLTPGPRLGVLLMHLRQERAFGRLHGRDDALQEAHRWTNRNRDAL